MKPKRCPFCGGDGEIRETEVDGYRPIGVRVVCVKCNAMGPWGAQWGPAPGVAGQIKAAEYWNGRVSDG